MRHFLLFPLLCAAAIVSIAVPVMAQLTGPEKRLTPREIDNLPAEAGGAGTSGLHAVTTTVLYGNPSAPGLYTIRLRVAPNTDIDAHTHKDTRTAVVISGMWYFGYGSRNERGALKALPAGSFYTEPGGQAHFARTGPKGAVVVITGYGPTDTVYVNK